ncbi:MICOS complex subunit MIC19-like [Ruditapes philippinarum]|uniref:MICOS complex subunit MIC19-like n=1 Tax=Ruditapes philippinarum TaxID=129788 RepID=UPI00295BFC02|nr:MICOS complex subunit MIC19-like [Ruditapes philippinarum]
MGGSQSTRQIVIDNQPNAVVISEDVERRLLGQPERNTSGESQELTQEQIDAIKHQIEKEYRQRITKASSETHRIKAAEFERAIREVEAKFIKQSGGPVCQDLQQEVYECYQNNMKQPLNCSRQVKAFTEAVQKARENAIMTKQT